MISLFVVLLGITLETDMMVSGRMGIILDRDLYMMLVPIVIFTVILYEVLEHKVTG